MRCLHCASDFYGPRKRGAELTTDEALDLCRQLAELGCEKVVLSGGEAILRSDWEQIAGCLSNLGVATSIITNGYAFDAEIAKRVHDLGMTRVGLSLDGLRDNHNLVRQNPASYDRALQAAKYICDTGVPLNIVTHINKKNLSELEELEDLVVSMGPVRAGRIRGPGCFNGRRCLAPSTRLSHGKPRTAPGVNAGPR
jgi:MoaA/NifB/PqqE/SkfB family radical SAM enzyme